MTSQRGRIRLESVVDVVLGRWRSRGATVLRLQLGGSVVLLGGQVLFSAAIAR